MVLEGVPEVGIRIFIRTPARDVPAAEAVAVGLENHHLDLAAAAGLVQAVVDFPHQRCVFGVGLVDAVEDDPGDRRFAFINDRLQDAPLHPDDITGTWLYWIGSTVARCSQEE